jgi:hypothetical protein
LPRSWVVPGISLIHLLPQEVVQGIVDGAGNPVYQILLCRSGRLRGRRARNRHHARREGNGLQPRWIGKIEWIALDISICIDPPTQPNRITLQIPPQRRIIRPLVVVEKPGLVVPVLAGESGVPGETGAEILRIAVRRTAAKRRRVPGPDGLLLVVVELSGRVAPVGVDVVRRAAEHEQRQVAEVDGFARCGAGGVVFADQVAGFVVDERGGGAIDGFADPLAEAVVENRARTGDWNCP